MSRSNNNLSAWRRAAQLSALFLFMLCLCQPVFAFQWQPQQLPMRIIIDTDAGVWRDDQHAVTYALLSPEFFEIEAFTAVHSGAGTLEHNFLEVHNIMGLAGIGGIQVLKGADHPMPGPGKPVKSEAVDFIIERSKINNGKRLVVLGIGGATN
ncbi:MAG: nucleoside hydrolase, partial [Gemmatimonadota bacterium]|nr:nucleoside hydrolase [Gemmatimonadota bacterium]